MTLRRWAALLALAGLALPGVRAEPAAGAAQTVPAALAAAPALAGSGGLRFPPAVPAPAAGNAPDAADAARLAALLTEADGMPLPVAPSPPTPPSPIVQPGPGLVPPEREYLRRILIRYAQENGLPADLVMAQAWKESSWRAKPVSHAGAMGVMQLMPATVEFASKNLLGLQSKLDPNNPAQNVRMGARFLRHLVDRSGGNYRQALIAYNQGLTSLRARGAYREAEQYADAVLSLRKEFRSS